MTHFRFYEYIIKCPACGYKWNERSLYNNVDAEYDNDDASPTVICEKCGAWFSMTPRTCRKKRSF